MLFAVGLYTEKSVIDIEYFCEFLRSVAFGRTLTRYSFDRESLVALVFVERGPLGQRLPQALHRRGQSSPLPVVVSSPDG